MARFQFALILLSTLALSGCISQLSNCGSAPPAKLSECIYTDAVMNQDPFSCYSIPDFNQRAKCIKDASDPNVRTQIQHALPGQAGPVFTEPPPSNASVPAQQAPSPANATANSTMPSSTDSYCHGKYPGLYAIGDTECNTAEADCTCWDATDRLCLPQSACE